MKDQSKRHLCGHCQFYDLFSDYGEVVLKLAFI